MIYHIVLPYACFGVITNTKGCVIRVPPIAKWMFHKHILVIKQWVSGKNGKCCEIKE
jgi:hypothetical protein